MLEAQTFFLHPSFYNNLLPLHLIPAGSGTPTKWGSGGVGKLQKAVSEAVGEGASSRTGPPKVEAFNFVYSDASLVGAQIVADAEDAGKVNNVFSTFRLLRPSVFPSEEFKQVPCSNCWLRIPAFC